MSETLMWANMAMTVANAFLFGFNLRSCLTDKRTKPTVVCAVFGAAAMVICGAASVQQILILASPR